MGLGYSYSYISGACEDSKGTIRSEIECNVDVIFVIFGGVMLILGCEKAETVAH